MHGTFDVWLSGFASGASNPAESLVRIFQVDHEIAKAMLRTLPKVVAQGLDQRAADKMLATLAESGAIAERVPHGMQPQTAVFDDAEQPSVIGTEVALPDESDAVVEAPTAIYNGPKPQAPNDEQGVDLIADAISDALSELETLGESLPPDPTEVVAERESSAVGTVVDGAPMGSQDEDGEGSEFDPLEEQPSADDSEDALDLDPRFSDVEVPAQFVGALDPPKEPAAPDSASPVKHPAMQGHGEDDGDVDPQIARARRLRAARAAAKLDEGAGSNDKALKLVGTDKAKPLFEYPDKPSPWGLLLILFALVIIGGGYYLGRSILLGERELLWILKDGIGFGLLFNGFLSVRANKRRVFVDKPVRLVAFALGMVFASVATYGVPPASGSESTAVVVSREVRATMRKGVHEAARWNERKETRFPNIQKGQLRALINGCYDAGAVSVAVGEITGGGDDVVGGALLINLPVDRTLRNAVVEAVQRGAAGMTVRVGEDYVIVTP